ncbi:hypothetical protein ENBRE01_2970 [Enteropsectra breve]|nr:hypothetical protein ENBRE01_2970 [Enteropsectra breve]
MGYCKVISNSTVNGDIFVEYITELCRYLRDELHMQDTCLILYSARIQRRAEIQRITTGFGYEFKFLLPHSYILSLIDYAFSKIKNGIRSKLRSGVQGILSDMMLTEVECFRTMTVLHISGISFVTILIVLHNCLIYTIKCNGRY